MKRAAVLCVLAFASANLVAQEHWKLNTSKSDFGGEPVPQSEILTITKNTPDVYAWHLKGVDGRGKSYTESWSGKPDGTAAPLKGWRSGMAGFTRESETSMLSHEEWPEGATDLRASLSDDKNTMTQDGTVRVKGGKESKVKLVWDRVLPPTKADKKAKKKKKKGKKGEADEENS